MHPPGKLAARYPPDGQVPSLYVILDDLEFVMDQLHRIEATLEKILAAPGYVNLEAVLEKILAAPGYVNLAPGKAEESVG